MSFIERVRRFFGFGYTDTDWFQETATPEPSRQEEPVGRPRSCEPREHTTPHPIDPIVGRRSLDEPQRLGPEWRGRTLDPDLEEPGRGRRDDVVSQMQRLRRGREPLPYLESDDEILEDEDE